MTDTSLPSLLHPLPEGADALRACAAAIRAHVDHRPELTRGEAFGKMYGALIADTADGRRGFLAAYSGLLGGRNDWPFFVPPVYDAQQPDGHFKTHERAISQLNRRIAALQSAPELAEARRELAAVERSEGAAVEQWRSEVKTRKAQRDALRHGAQPIDEATRCRLVRESQFDKAELRRRVKAAEAAIAARRAEVERLESEVEALKRERRSMSDSLQRWLFAQYRVLNARGEERDLISLFSLSVHTLPPAGAGDCCAPKLLQWAYAHALRPVALAEFWLGAPPPGEVRRHMQFYPPCRSKCRPILEFMLQGLDAPLPGTEEVFSAVSRTAQAANRTTQAANRTAQAADNAATAADSSLEDGTQTLRTVYEDSCMAVVSKPAGMLTVPGKDGRESVESIVRRRYGLDAGVPVIVHRLDMDTSGLLLVALTREAHKALQQQFLNHGVSKRYVALLEGVPTRPGDNDMANGSEATANGGEATANGSNAMANGSEAMMNGGKAASPHVVWHTASAGTISLPLRPDLDDRPRQLVDFVHGRPAVTRFCLLRVVDGRQLVALTPVTGRTHQLRMHCAHHLGLACPILGDALYGSADSFPRLCLHAAQITFRHPTTGQIMTFDDEVPFARESGNSGKTY